MYKEALQSKLRFHTSKGVLTTEHLFDLSLNELNVLAKAYNKKIKDSEEADFLQESTKEDKLLKLSFDIILDVLNTKKAIKDKIAKAAELRSKKQLLKELINEKKNEGLKNSSIEELEAELKKLEE